MATYHKCLTIERNHAIAVFFLIKVISKCGLNVKNFLFINATIIANDQRTKLIAFKDNNHLLKVLEDDIALNMTLIN